MTVTKEAGGLSDLPQVGFGPAWVSKDEAVALHRKQLHRFGGPGGIRDEGALESALARPRNKWEYEGADMPGLAAAYGFGIARNHPFVDGNKRAAFVTLMLFLRKNGLWFSPPQAEATRMMLSLAAGEVSEESLARWIRDRSDFVSGSKG